MYRTFPKRSVGQTSLGFQNGSSWTRQPRPEHGQATNHLPRCFYAEGVGDWTYRSVRESLEEHEVCLRATTEGNRGPRDRDAGECERRRSGHTRCDVQCVPSPSVAVRPRRGSPRGSRSQQYRVSHRRGQGPRSADRLRPLALESGSHSWPPRKLAEELLEGRSGIHLYRHDIESLFLRHAADVWHHTIGRGERLPCRVV